MKKAFDLKSARMDTLAIYLNQTEQAALTQELAERAKSMTAWQGMALLLDLQAFSSPNELALAEILALFSEAGLPIRALRHQDEAWLQVALAHGLAFCQPDGYRETSIIPEPPAAQAEPIVPKPLLLEGVRKTMVVERPIRTGQQVYAENADLIVLGMVSEGAEVIADGHVHIYAPLRGRALAGAEGDQEARIFVQSMQAELVSVAGIYRTFEQALPAHLQRQAVQIYLHEGRLVISAFSQ